MKKTLLAVLVIVFGTGFAVGQNEGTKPPEISQTPAAIRESKEGTTIDAPKPVVEPTTGVSTPARPSSSVIKGMNEQPLKKKYEKSSNPDTGKPAAIDIPKTQVLAPSPVVDATIENMKILLTKPYDIEALANFIRDEKEEADNAHLTAAKKMEKAWRTEKDYAANSNRHFWIAMVLGFLTVLGLIIGGVISQKALKKNHADIISRVTKSMESDLTTGHLRYSTSGLESENIDLKLQLGQAKKMIEELKKPNPTTSNETNSGSKIVISSRDAAPAKINRYFNSPNPTDKSFNDLNGSTSIQPFTSTYEITFDRPDSETASFRLLASQETLRKILNTPETYIEPMCQAENAFNPMAKNITTKEDGVVKKRDGIWYLETKARIRYE